MKGSFLASAAAFGFLTLPAWAQEATPDNQQVREGAIQSAQGLGIQSVQALEGAFVLEGISAQGTPLLMVVGPAGELLALANPIAGAAPADAGVAAGTAEEDSDPAAGEEAEDGFMATQTQPATPQMWDPAIVEGEIQGLGSRAGGEEQAEPQE